MSLETYEKPLNQRNLFTSIAKAFFSFFGCAKKCEFIYVCNIFSPNIFLAHRLVENDYLVSFLMKSCHDVLDYTLQFDDEDFALPMLIILHFLIHWELHWMVHLIIQHKLMLNLLNVHVDHPEEKTKETNNEKNFVIFSCWFDFSIAYLK